MLQLSDETQISAACNLSDDIADMSQGLVTKSFEIWQHIPHTAVKVKCCTSAIFERQVGFNFLYITSLIATQFDFWASLVHPET